VNKLTYYIFLHYPLNDFKLSIGRMVLRRMGPCPEHEPEKSDVQIIEEVLHEKNASKASTFPGRMGVTDCRIKNAVSTARERDLEQRLADQEEHAVHAAQRYKDMTENRMHAHDVILDDLRKEHE
jgi:hypothetical protein